MNAPRDDGKRSNWWGWLFAFPAAALFWLLMQGVHEFGHVLHAWTSGGTVTRVVLHPLTISRTDVAPNPHPRFVAWGGFVWGAAIPLAAWLLLHRLRWRLATVAGLFAAFCLVANGGYLSTAVISPAGDVRDLIQLGESVWVMFGLGLAGVAAGLYAAHRAETNAAGRDLNEGVGPRHVLGVTIALAIVIMLECLLSPRF